MILKLDRRDQSSLVDSMSSGTLAAYWWREYRRLKEMSDWMESRAVAMEDGPQRQSVMADACRLDILADQACAKAEAAEGLAELGV